MKRTIIIKTSKSNHAMMYHFNALAWMIKAASTDATRENLYQTISVQDGICYATDGHRLHIYSQDEELPVDAYLMDGLYEIKAVSKKQIILIEKDTDADFPDVTPLLSYRHLNGIPPLTWDARDDKDQNYGFFLHHLLGRVRWAFNERYLREAYMSEETMYFEQGLRSAYYGTRPIIFGNERRLAVIQPLNP